MKNEKKNKKKKSIEEMTASEIGEKLLDELKAQGPKKGTKGNTYITRAGGSGAKKIMGAYIDKKIVGIRRN